ncbi:TPA: hypothetical protein P5S16_003008 [Salmonella enterica subsp. enterica serovar Concord]|nr:hypothetical protein [Salmonella enterica]HDP0195589.1 hypothetical protein [Salmonella enterica subsp. enterica serovar Concord]HDP0199668.1 hypothetical protein [Salmonella enterica subsp. enterica serovar Concord]
MPLPLRDYYPAERAAELLGCTIDDLICWGEKGQIRLCIRLNKIAGFLKIYNPLVFYDGLITDLGLPPLSENDSEENMLIDVMDNIYNAYVNNKGILNKIRDKTCFATFFQLFYTVNRDNNCHIRSDYYSDELKFELVNRFLGRDYAYLTVSMREFFALPTCFYKVCGNFETLNDDSYLNTTDYLMEVIPCINEPIEITIDDLFVLKNDFIRIREASKNGDELTDVFEDIVCNSSSLSSDKYRLKRSSSASISALKALIINYHSDVKDNPSKLADVLTLEAERAGLGKIKFSKDTVSRWMKED